MMIHPKKKPVKKQSIFHVNNSNVFTLTDAYYTSNLTHGNTHYTAHMCKIFTIHKITERTVLE